MIVNREQEVIDRVTEPLSDMLELDFNEALSSEPESVFDIDTIGHRVHMAASGSIVAPVDEHVSFDLFSKLQDEEPMDALDPTK